MSTTFEKPDLLKIARQLRRNMTTTEKILWERLRARRLCGYKFRRQHVVRNAIADFYCHELRLIVEVDGAIHEEPSMQERDQERDFQLATHGYHTIRIREVDILINVDEVCHRIVDAIYEEIKMLHPFSPSLAEGVREGQMAKPSGRA